MLYTLKEVFNIKGSYRFFYEMENIFGSTYLEQYAEQFVADCETSQDLATALVDMLGDERETIIFYYLGTGLTEAEADEMYTDLEESLALVEIGN